MGNPMADQLRALLTNRTIENPVMVGIHTGGVWVAERLHRQLKLDDPLSTLDISFYRVFPNRAIRQKTPYQNLDFCE